MDSRLYSKASIIAEAWREYRHTSDEMWQNFFEINDLGVPIAIALSHETAEPTDKGITYLNETWVDLCRLVMVDSDAEYDFLDEMLEIGVIDDDE